MQRTTNYNLKKPDYTDFADIQDINDNMEIIDEKLASPDGDARGEVVTFTDDDLDSGITSFPTFLTKIVSGMKIAKFFRDFKAGMQYVLHKGSLINNGTCNTAGEYALDAAYGKVLRDDIDSLNSSLSSKWAYGYAMYDRHGTDQSFTSDLLKQSASVLADINVTIRWEPSTSNDYYLSQIIHSGTRFQFAFDLNGAMYTCVVLWNRSTGTITVSGKSNCYLYRISPLRPLI